MRSDLAVITAKRSTLGAWQVAATLIQRKSENPTFDGTIPDEAA